MLFFNRTKLPLPSPGACGTPNTIHHNFGLCLIKAKNMTSPVIPLEANEAKIVEDGIWGTKRTWWG